MTMRDDRTLKSIPHTMTDDEFFGPIRPDERQTIPRAMSDEEFLSGDPSAASAEPDRGLIRRALDSATNTDFPTPMQVGLSQGLRMLDDMQERDQTVTGFARNAPALVSEGAGGAVAGGLRGTERLTGSDSELGTLGKAAERIEALTQGRVDEPYQEGIVSDSLRGVGSMGVFLPLGAAGGVAGRGLGAVSGLGRTGQQVARSAGQLGAAGSLAAGAGADEAYQRAKEYGLDHEGAQRVARWYGTTGGLIQIGNINILLRRLPPQAREALFRGTGGRILSAAASEAFVEGLGGGIVQNLGQMSYDDTQELWDGVGYRALIGSIAAGVTTAGRAAAVRGAEKLKGDGTDSDQDVLDALATLAEQDPAVANEIVINAIERSEGAAAQEATQALRAERSRITQELMEFGEDASPEAMERAERLKARLEQIEPEIQALDEQARGPMMDREAALEAAADRAHALQQKIDRGEQLTPEERVEHQFLRTTESQDELARVYGRAEPGYERSLPEAGPADTEPRAVRPPASEEEQRGLREQEIERAFQEREQAEAEARRQDEQRAIYDREMSPDAVQQREQEAVVDQLRTERPPSPAMAQALERAGLTRPSEAQPDTPPVADQQPASGEPQRGLRPMADPQLAGRAEAPPQARREPELIDDDSSLADRTRADIAGQDPQTAGLLGVRNFLDAWIEDFSVPTEINERVVTAREQLQSELDSSDADIAQLHRDTLAEIRAWRQDASIDSDVATELDALASVLEAAAQPVGAPTQQERVARQPDPEQQVRSAQPRAPIQPAATGREARVRTSRGEEYPAQWAVVDASQLVSSHTPDGRVNPDFPAELQPRDRTRVASQQQVQRMVNEGLRPEELGDTGRADQGAPVIGPDGVVESGNARTMAIRASYERGSADNYRQWIQQQAEALGIDPAALEGMQAPVLVRQRTGDLDSRARARFTRDANVSDVAQMSPAEQAVSDAALISDEMMVLYAPDESGNVLASSNRPFLQAFARELGDQQTGRLVTADGRWNKQMADRARAAVFAKAYGDQRLVDAIAQEADPGLRNVLNALQAAAPAFARARAIDPTLGPLDVITPLVEGVEIIRQSRSEGQAVEELVSQAGMFGDVSPEAATAARFMDRNARSAKRMAEAFTRIGEYVETALRYDQNDNLFGDSPADTAVLQVLEQAIQATESPDAAPRRQPAQAEATDQPERVRPPTGRRDEGRQPDEGGRRAAPAEAPEGEAERVTDQINRAVTAENRDGINAYTGESADVMIDPQPGGDASIEITQTRSRRRGKAVEHRTSQQRVQYSSIRDQLSEEARSEIDAAIAAEQAEDPGELALETQTEESLAAREQEQQRAEQAEADRRQQEEQRAQADRERDDFTLTGSDRAADVAAARGQESMFRLSPPARVQALRDRLQEAISSHPELQGVRVRSLAAELPAAVQQRMLQEGINPASVRGVYVGGELMVVAENVSSLQDGIRVAVHEAVGHRGVREVLGQRLRPAMNQIYASFPRNHPVWEQVLRQYPHIQRNTPEGRQEFAEELVAHLAETNPQVRPWQRFVARVRDLLRQVFPEVAWNNNDVRALIQRSRDRMADQALADGTYLHDAGAEDTRFSVAPPTESQAFRNWFRDSKVVDDNGRPLVVFHGTTGDFSGFARDMLGGSTAADSAAQGFFFTSDTRTAESYAQYAATDGRVARLLRQADEAESRGDWDAYDDFIVQAEALEGQLNDFQARLGGQNVMPVYLSLQDPLVIDAGGRTFAEMEERLSRRIRLARVGRRHDGVIIRNLDDAAGLTDQVADHYVAFEPTQIKSAIGNQGTFDPSDPDIRFSLSEAPSPQSAADLAGRLREQYPGLKLNIRERAGIAYIDRIELPKGQRESGVGTEIMGQITAWADGAGKTLALTPSGDFGGSVRRLNRFYRRFGFVENKGRNRDFEISESMLRRPEGGVDVRFSLEDGPESSAWRRAEAKGLDMSQDARMRRARQMGYIASIDEATTAELADDGQITRRADTPGADAAGSSVRGDEGAPATFYHGSAADIRAFQTGHPDRSDAGWLGHGIYVTSDPGLASSYANIKAGSEEPNVMPLFIRPRSLLRVNLGFKRRLQNAPPAAAIAMTERLQAEGFDGAVLVFDNAQQTAEIVVFDPENIRSTQAAFDPDGQGDADVLFSIAPPVESEAFKRWFGDSKVVDDQGRPQITYRGLREPYSPEKSSGIIWSTPDPDYAAEYARPLSLSDSGGNVMPLYVAAENPFNLGFRSVMTQVKFGDVVGRLNDAVTRAFEAEAISQAQGRKLMKRIDRLQEQDTGEFRRVHEWITSRNEIKEVLQAAGYDSIRQKEGFGDRVPAIGVFSPSQVKSVFNQGTFDPDSPDIRFSVSADESLSPETAIDPVNEVSQQKRASLAGAFRAAGEFTAPPVLVYRGGSGALVALTGSHRIAAAQDAGVDIPVVYVNDGLSDFVADDGRMIDDVRGFGDEDVARFMREFGDHRAAAIMDAEADANVDAPDTSARAEFSAAEGSPVRRMSAPDVSEAISDVVLGWEAGPRVEVVETWEQLPGHLVDQAIEAGLEDGVRGVYDTTGGEPVVYLVAEQMRSATDARKTLAHEAIGHYGMETLLGEDYSWVLDRVQHLKHRDPRVRAAAEHVAAEYGDLPGPLESAEVIAYLAENRVSHPVLKRVHAALRRFLRSLGFRVPFSATELDAMLVRAQRMLRTGRGMDSGAGRAAGPQRDGDVRFARGSRSAPDDMPQIDSRVSEIAKLRGFFRSAVDVLREHGQGLEDMGNRVEQFFQSWRRRQGEAFGLMWEPLRALERLPKSSQDRVLKRFADYNRAMENNRQSTARAIYENSPKLTRSLIDAWAEVAQMTADQNEQVGVEVFDPKTGGYRPIGRAPRFWPRTLTQETQDVLANPHRNAKTLQRWNEMVDELIADGHIQDRDEAARYLNSYLETGGNDYFSALERARTEPLPESFREYGLEAALQYMENWSRRLSQIEQFGQKKGEHGQDEFDRVRALTTDRGTQEYLDAVRHRVYNEIDNTIVTRTVQRGNMLATAIHLGNPATAGLNLIGGTSLNIMAFGWAPTAKGAFTIASAMIANNPRRALQTWRSDEYADALNAELSATQRGRAQGKRAWQAFKDLMTIPEDLHQDMARMGVLRNDFLAIHTDAMQMGLTGSGDRLMSRATMLALKAGGYTPFEYFIRSNAALAGKNVLSTALQEWNANPMSAKSRSAYAFFQRHKFDTSKLIQEAGAGPETERWILYASNLTQGTYQIDQTPIFIDTPLGRTMLKYQKFASQVNRLYYNQVHQPMKKSLQGGEPVEITLPSGQVIQDRAGRVQPFIDALRFFSVPIFAYAFLLEPMREKLFGYLAPSPGWDELAKAFEDDETYAGVMMLMQKAWYGLIGLGAFGLFGNYGQAIMDYADRQRFKNPLDPPILAPIDGITDMVTRYIDQDGTLTKNDVDDVLTATFSQYRTATRLGQTALIAAGSEARTAELEAFRRDRSYVRRLIRRYADESGIEAKRRAPDSVIRTAMTPVNRKILEELALGNPQSARQIAIDYLTNPDLAPEDVEGAHRSMLSAVRAYDPARVALAPSEAERARFLSWVEGRVGQANEERVRRISEGYREAAREGGFLRSPPPSAEVRAMMDQFRADTRYGTPEAREAMVDMLLGPKP